MSKQLKVSIKMSPTKQPHGHLHDDVQAENAMVVPTLSSSHAMLQWQRQYGNRYVQRMVGISKRNKARGRLTPLAGEMDRFLVRKLVHIRQQTSARLAKQERHDGGIGGPRDAGVPAGVAMPQQLATPHQIPSDPPATTTTTLQTSGARSVYTPILPGYSQEGPSCGAASLVTALIIWDRQRSDRSAPNELVVNACNIILTHLAQNHESITKRWTKFYAERRINAEELYLATFTDVTNIRDHARAPGANFTEQDYRTLGLALYILYDSDSNAGLTSNDIEHIQSQLGLSSDVRPESVMTFEEIFATSSLQGLQPGQIAQVDWYARRGRPNPQGNVSLGEHTFLIGRLNNGEWFMSDQGTKPATEIRAPNLDILQTLIIRQSNIHSGTIIGRSFTSWSGIRVIGDPNGLRNASSRLIPPGTFLAEVDAGVLTIGNHVVSGAYVSHHFDFSTAQAAARSVPMAHGAVIVEMPPDVYTVFITNSVSESNVEVSEIDSAEGGLLTQHTFFGAWLLLRSSGGRKTRLLRVY